MAKYDPLRDHLRKQTLGELIMSFSEVERLVGPLPSSADRPQWWANVRSQTGPRVQRGAWRMAGYDAFLIAGSNRVRFVRLTPDARALSGPRIMPPTARDAPKTIAPPLPAKPILTAQALLAGGFELTSRGVLTEDGRLGLESPLPSQPGVYAFVMKGLAVYVGIAASGLANRLKFYVRPGVTQRTSQRVNARLIEELKTVGFIDILTARPPDASWNGWPINAAAGLEVGLIANYDVPWNMRGV
jgi:hypothetical protein